MTSKPAEADHPLRNIYFYLTEGCNLACRHCWIGPGYQHGDLAYPYLPPDLVSSILDQGIPLGLTDVKLTGGEPLLHPQILQILRSIRKRGLKLNIETNGTLCTPQIANAIAASNSPFVSISLDGADAPTHEWVRCVPGCFEATLEGLGNLVQAGLKPQIIATLMKRNRDQIEELIQLAETSGAGSLKFNVMQPSARGERMHQEGESLSIGELEEIARRVNLMAERSKIRIFFDRPLAFQSLKSMFGDRGNGCCVCQIKSIIGVLADGSYAICGIGKNIPELRLGHASSDRLESVWRQSTVLREIRCGLPGKLRGVCKECMMADICLGKCIAQNYYKEKDLWAPNWYCREAELMGIFPESRRRGALAQAGKKESFGF